MYCEVEYLPLEIRKEADDTGTGHLGGGGGGGGMVAGYCQINPFEITELLHS